MKKDFLRISVENGILKMQWIGHANAEQFQEGLEAGLSVIIERGLKCWLADVVEMAALDQEFFDWYNANWYPRLVRSGLERMAFVHSPSVYNQALIESSIISAHSDNSFRTQYFHSYDEATKWLREIVTVPETEMRIQNN